MNNYEKEFASKLMSVGIDKINKLIDKALRGEEPHGKDFIWELKLPKDDYINKLRLEVIATETTKANLKTTIIRDEFEGRKILKVDLSGLYNDFTHYGSVLNKIENKRYESREQKYQNFYRLFDEYDEDCTRIEPSNNNPLPSETIHYKPHCHRPILIKLPSLFERIEQSLHTDIIEYSEIKRWEYKYKLRHIKRRHVHHRFLHHKKHKFEYNLYEHGGQKL